jgi:tyrosinase
MSVLGQKTEIPKFASSSMAVASSQLDQLAQHALDVTKIMIDHSQGNCTLESLQVRRDWRAFSTSQKKAYLESVLCLQALPARTPLDLAPGVRSRYDDFVATHINQTLMIHRTVRNYDAMSIEYSDFVYIIQGTFLGWHRYFIHEFHAALRDECGYIGDYP